LVVAVGLLLLACCLWFALLFALALWLALTYKYKNNKSIIINDIAN
jgi:hypothetical protein